jgi:hypothetical protein
MNWILWLCNPKLYNAIQPYKVTEDALMPWAYQFANPNGRPYHNDWGVMSSNPILKFFQPFQKIRRMDCAYRIPLPFKCTSGAKTQSWVMWNKSYPLSPDTQIEYRNVETSQGVLNLPFVLIDEGIDGAGWTTWSGYINGQWVECFKRYSVYIFGKRLAYYNGLKPDVLTLIDENGKPKSDNMVWFPEISISYIKQ